MIHQIAFLSDIHFGIRNSSKEWLDYQKDYFYNFFIPLIYSNNISSLIIAGDVFDNRQSINLLVLHEVVKIFEVLASKLTEIHIIAGNHDVFLKSSNEISSLDIISKISDNIIVYKEPAKVKIKGLKFYMLPWIYDKQLEASLIQENSDNDRYLVCHSEIKGFKYNTLLEVKEGLTTSVYDGYKKVLSGHFHFRQSKGNISYLGCPMHYSRNDIGDIKGVTLLSTYSEVISFVENVSSPKFIRLSIVDLLETSLEDLKALTSNNFVDFTVPRDFIEKYNLNFLFKELEEAKSIKVNIVETAKTHSIVASESASYSVVDLCVKYMKDNKFDTSDKDKIISYITNIYSKINT